MSASKTASESRDGKSGGLRKDLKRKSHSDPKKSPKEQDDPAPKKKRKTEELFSASSSAEAHAKQREVAKTRKLSKPNANEIERAKKLWERLRRKSHVHKEERQKLVTELFGLIAGKVQDFVFKHDSVRTIQTALKYANQEQRKMIAQELKGQYRLLVEGRYSKFLVAKILVQGDAETRAMVVQEFYGHVKKLINHPEASWILDDTYRQVATSQQKAKLLREWYGAEYAMLQSDNTQSASADLIGLLKASPEKRQPTLKHLHDMINQLIQKKMTAFTMLHDAMLQYSLAIATAPDGTLDTKNEANRDWVQELIPDEEEDFDLLKNLAFTASGCRVTTRLLALATAKDRRKILRVYKDHVEALACDANAVHVILAAYEVVDDTKMTSKLIFPELLGEKIVDQAEQEAAILAIATHPVGRVAILWPLVANHGRVPKWLVQPKAFSDVVMAEVMEIKAVAETSKKRDETRYQELSQALLATSKHGIFHTIEHNAASLATTPFGCHLMTEALLNAGEEGTTTAKDARIAVADLAVGDPGDQHAIVGSAAGGRMLKTLAQGGPFDLATKTTKHVPWLEVFPGLLFERIKPHIDQWASGSESFVPLALVENEQFQERKEVLKALAKHKKALMDASKKGNKGAEMLLGKL